MAVLDEIEGVGKGYDVVDLTDNEMAKLHVRHMVGGRAAGVAHERLFRFDGFAGPLEFERLRHGPDAALVYDDGTSVDTSSRSGRRLARRRRTTSGTAPNEYGISTP